MKEVLWKSFIVFITIFALLWIIFYTYQPEFLDDEDFVGPGNSGRGGDDVKNESDKYLSDRGRAIIFLASIITGLCAGLLFFLVCHFYINRNERGKKGLRDLEMKKINEQEIELII